MVVQEREDLDVPALGAVGSCQAVVGEVGLSALVGHVGLEAHVDERGRIFGCGVTNPSRIRIRLIVAG